MTKRNKIGQYQRDLALYKWFISFVAVGAVIVITLIGINNVWAKLTKTFGVVIVVKNTYAMEQEPTLMERIPLVEAEYGLKKDTLYNVIKCESNFRTNVYGDGGKAYGWLQFHRDTFELFKRQSGMLELDYYSPENQLTLAGWAFSRGKAHHWSCAR